MLIKGRWQFFEHKNNSLETKLSCSQKKKSFLTKFVAILQIYRILFFLIPYKLLMNSRPEFDHNSLKSPPAAELSYRIQICPHLLHRICSSLCNGIENREQNKPCMCQHSWSRRKPIRWQFVQLKMKHLYCLTTGI